MDPGPTSKKGGLVPYRQENTGAESQTFEGKKEGAAMSGGRMSFYSQAGRKKDHYGSRKNMPEAKGGILSGV